jgi:tetratricopeptide (TPR) repeat protein
MMNPLDRAMDAVARGDYEAAIEASTQAIDAKQCLPLAYRHRGYSYARLGHWDEAIKDLTKAITLDPSAANAFANRGRAFMEIGDYPLAISDCTEAIRIQPDHAGAYMQRGSAYMDMGEQERAIADFTRAIDLGIDAPGCLCYCYVCRGELLRVQGDYSGAIADATAAIRREPSALAHFNRARAYSEAGDLHAAVADCSAAIELDATYRMAFVERGRRLFDLQRFAEAVGDFTRAIDLDPNDGETVYCRAIAHRCNGDAAKAEADFKRAEELGYSPP